MKLFVWDFHGVLEKDNDLGVLDISNTILAQAGYTERFSEEDNRRFYGLNWYVYFERLLPQLSNKEHLALQAACFKYSEDHPEVIAKHIKPNDHVFDVLRAIHDAGNDQIIISNSRPKDILWFVNTIKIRKYFPIKKIIGVNGHELHVTKNAALRDYLKNKSFTKTVIVGDSENDMKLKEVNNGVAYFYNHPHLNPRESILADYVISDLKEVLCEL
jgi:phosphoglycolate phosphatase-like HAD superfamily hydrolase